jgi:AcrR family transcriptional regulator
MPVYASQMRVKLARSAFELFAQRGIRNVNLDEIAAHAGVTKGSIYWHYKSKKEVILAACDHYYLRWRRHVRAEIAACDHYERRGRRRARAEIAAGADPFDQLERVLRFSVQSCLFDRANRVFTTEIFALSLQDDDIRASWAEFYDAARELNVGLVQAAKARGQLAVDDPRGAVNWMMAATEGIKQRASFEAEICTPDEREATVEGLIRILRNASRGASQRPE